MRRSSAGVARHWRKQGAAEPPDSAPGTNTAVGKPPLLVTPAATLALKDGAVNSLGMKFLPVKGNDMLFCIHALRYKAYAAYATEAQAGSGSWKDQSADGFIPSSK